MKMELGIARGISSNLPLLQPTTILSQSTIHNTIHSRFLFKKTPFKAGLRFYKNSSLRCKTSEETSIETPLYARDEPEPDSGITVESEDNRTSEEKNNQLNEVPQEGSWIDNLGLSKLLEELDIKLDYEETYSLLVFGGGGVVALWLASAVVGAIDSIPVLPKVLELVGLGYTIWFSSRYLIFKENRDELVARVEQLKKQVLGSKDD